MKNRASKTLILLLCLSSLGAESIPAQIERGQRFQGFLGSYHPYKGTAFGVV